MPRVLLQEIERKVLRFLTPITWAKLGMFSAVGVVYGTQLFLQDFRLSNVASVLSTHEAWSDIRRGTISALGRWRRRHTFLPKSAISWKVAFDFFRHTVGTTRSAILSVAGHRRPKRLFRFFVSAVGWCRTPSLGDLPGTSGTSQRMGWSHIASYTTTPAQECASTSQMVPVEGTPQCSQYFCQTGCSACVKNPYNVVSVPSLLIISTICHAVLQRSDNSIRDAANLPPIIDGRHSLMLQERWEGSVLASILAFFFAIWTVRSMHRRGVHFLSFLELRDLVLVSLQCPWLVRCCPTRSHKQRQQDRVCPPLSNPEVTIYRSDGACGCQGTITETLAGWGAAVWSADARGLGAGVAFATARGFLGNEYSNNQAEYFALLQCLFRALRLQGPHVIFEVDSLILAKHLARHFP